MVGGRSQFPYGRTVFLGRIAFVLGPVVLWIFLMQFQHEFIPMGLCQHRSGGNMHVLSVSFYHTFKGDIAIRFESVSIYSNELWGLFHLGNSAVHGQMGRVQNVQLVYFFHHYVGYPVANGFRFQDGA